MAYPKRNYNLVFEKGGFCIEISHNNLSKIEDEEKLGKCEHYENRLSIFSDIELFSVFMNGLDLSVK